MLSLHCPQRIKPKMDRQIYYLLVLVSAMGLTLLAIIVAEPAINGGGIPHPELPGMQAGGDGAARLEHIGNFALFFHFMLLALISALCVLGVAKQRRSPALIIGASICMLLNWFIAWQMYQGHQDFLASGETGYFLGFPTATAWAVYGTWLGAIPLIVVYVAGFKRFIFTPEDKAKYQELLDQKSREQD